MFKILIVMKNYLYLFCKINFIKSLFDFSYRLIYKT